jgi:ribonuclease HII
MRLLGIDEAGYGPTLGPLAIVGVAAEAESLAAVSAAFALAATNVRDSKSVHTPGDIAAIEAVALPAIAWLAGGMPETAAACFALLGEQPGAHLGMPWLEPAATLRLPVAAAAVEPLSLPQVRPAGLTASLIQPRMYNDRRRSGLNKAELELGEVGRLLAALKPATGPGAAVVDRLGGRRYYRPALQAVWPDAIVLIECETAALSRYVAVGAGYSLEVGFHVAGESASPLTAMASCIAKYARELHMLLLNRYWHASHPKVRPTAGYPEDARRWLGALGDTAVAPFRDVLIRSEARAVPELVEYQGTRTGNATVERRSSR